MDVYVEHTTRVELKLNSAEFRALWCLVDETYRQREHATPVEQAIHGRLTGVISSLPGN